MIIRGIAKGDKDLRHFTFDDEDYVIRGGIYYYKVNYGKNKLEGEYGEDEIGYIECDKVLALGGKKPKPIPGRNADKVVKQEKALEPEVVKKPAKRGRPPKVTKEEVSSETIPVSVSGGVSTYEYYVTELKITDMQELQDELNELGLKGWELCCYDIDRSLFSNTIRLIFKRKRG